LQIVAIMPAQLAHPRGLSSLGPGMAFASGLASLSPDCSLGFHSRSDPFSQQFSHSLKLSLQIGEIVFVFRSESRNFFAKEQQF
jgi:hypothetical protein